MNIPPKYEDVVEKLDAALGREAALREELDSAKRLLRSIQLTMPHLEAKNADSARQILKQINDLIGSMAEEKENA